MSFYADRMDGISIGFSSAGRPSAWGTFGAQLDD